MSRSRDDVQPRFHLLRQIAPLLVLSSFAAVAMIVVTGACGGSSEPDQLPPLSPSSKARKDAGAPGAADTGAGSTEEDDDGGDPILVVDGGTGSIAHTFKGTLNETLPVKFGGDPYCQYSVKMKPISVEVAVLDTGEVIGAVVKDTTIEAVIVTTPPCPYGPMAPTAQSFSLTTATKNDAGTGTTLSFKGSSSNQPATSLTLDLVKNGAAYDVTGKWKRTDIGAPLDWQLTAKLTLTQP